MANRTLFCADWVLPVTAAPIENGAVLVDDDSGRIEAIGTVQSFTDVVDARRVELRDAILLPGLINVHAHPELSFLRGALEDLPFHQWIPRLRRIKMAVSFTAEELRDAARWTCAESIAAGVTTLAATEDSDGAMHALRDAGMRGIAFREVFGPSPESVSVSIDGLRSSVDAMRELETELVRVGVSPHAPYSVSDALFTAVCSYATSESLRVAVHTAESHTEQLLVARGEGDFAAGLRARGIDTPPRATSTVQLLQRTGILDCAPLLIHCVRVTDEDIALMSAAGAAVAHCPVANARLGHGIAPVPEMLDAGVRVGIGSDSVASGNRIDLLEEARVAQMMQRARLTSPTVLPAEQLLRLVTIDAARALRIDDRVGSLEPGKEADLCAISIAAPHCRPVFDPVGTLFMSCRGSDTIMTVVGGRIVYELGAFTTIDVESLRRRMDHMGSRVRAAADGS
jgi:5-methylthioadenosine/S-adenosylhomocysteine deaminase